MERERASLFYINRVRMNIPSSGLAVLSRSRDVGLSVLHVIHAAQVPFGVPDPYPADPTHPSAWYTCRAGSQPAISPIPCPWHRARPTCAWRSTFNLSRCLCASLSMWKYLAVACSDGMLLGLALALRTRADIEVWAVEENAALRQGSSADGMARSWRSRR